MSEYRFELRKQFPLEGVGTRWDHYAELREVFALGISVIEQTRPEHRIDGDERKLVKLKNAVEMIDRRIELLSNYDDLNTSWGGFGLMLRKIEQEKREGVAKWTKELKPIPLLTEGKNESQKPENIGSSGSTENPEAPPDEPVGV